MSELKALIFDVDGTLADTERDGHRPAFNAAFKEKGLDWEWDVALYGKLLQVTGGKERMRHYLNEFNTSFQRPEAFDEFIADLHRTKTRHYMSMMAEGRIPLRPGVKRLLQEARDAGMRLAIATTTTPENVTSLLENALSPDAISWFEVIAAGDIVPAKKPDPAIYQYTLEKMGLKADQCIAFEDSRNGLLSAIGADLRTLVTVNGYTEEHDFSEAVLVLDQLGEPGQEAHVIAGPPLEKGFVDLAAIHHLAA